MHALPGVAAEFYLSPSLLKPPQEPVSFSCSRFDGFCPRAYYSGGPQEVQAQQSGAGRLPLGITTANALSLLLVAAATLRTVAVWI